MGGSASSEKADENRQRQIDLYKRDKTYEAAEIGYHAKRHCTDLCGLVLYIAGFAAMMFVAATGFENGDPVRLMYGTDRAGYVCGHEYNGNVPDGFNIQRNGTAVEWSDMKYLVYPLPSHEVCAERLVANDPPTCEDLIRDTLEMGTCWYECPEAGTHVTWYDGTDEWDGNNVGFSVVVNTKSTLHRCFPVEPDAILKGFDDHFGVSGTALAELEVVLAARWTILLCLFIAILLSFIWLFILRCTVKPVVFTTVFLLWVLSAGLVYLTYNNYNKATGDAATVWMLLLVAAAIWILLYTCLLVFFCKSINVACDCIEEAAKIPFSLPSMNAVPPIVTLCIIPVAVFHIVVWMYLETSGSVEPRTIDHYANITDPTGAMGELSKVTVSVMSHPNYIPYAKIYNVFMFFWSMNLWISCGYMAVAFCAVFWYWSTPGDNKSPEAGLCTAICWTVRYHLGTVMLGSLIVAVLQTIRFVLAQFEDRMRRINESSTVQCVLACVQCCLACFERLIKFINNNAYIMTCMCSDNFCNGARRAIFLLIKHAGSVMAVNLISGWVMFFGKLQIVSLSLLIGWQLLSSNVLVEGDESAAVQDHLGSLIIIAVIAYVVVSVFINVFATCIDVVVLSYTYDLDVNNGTDKPYYLPSDLQRSLGKKNDANFRGTQEMAYTKMSV